MSEPAFRPATLDDAARAADLMTASYPGYPQDPVVTRYRWAHPRRGWSAGRFIVELEGAAIAFLDWLHGPPEQDEGRHCEVGVSLDRAHLDLGLLTILVRWVTAHATATGSLALEAYAFEDEPDLLEALRLAGYARDRVDRLWELDLAVHGARLVAEAELARRQVEAQGLELLTVAGWAAPGRFEALHALDARTRQDIPTTFPILPETFDNFLERCRAPDRRHDTWWIAVDGERPVAMSYLRFPPVRGAVWTGYTCCDPDYRGRGLARGVKLQSLAQAVGLGVPSVSTDNDSENAPMLHINERLGYRSRPGLVGHLMRVDRSHA
jgi:RimJ/RimL family protein N-acetyltransferase